MNIKFIKFISIIAILLLGYTALSQVTKVMQEIQTECKFEFDSTLNKIIYFEVDSIPVFDGDEFSFLLYFRSKYNILNDSVDFIYKFRFEFIVDIDGSIICEMIKGKQRELLAKSEIEALRIIKNMPKWRPGKCNGKIVPVKVYLPIILHPK